MAKNICKGHMDVIGLLADQDRRENELFGLDTTRPMSSWASKVMQRLLRLSRSKDSPINQKHIRQAIKDEWGKVDKVKELAMEYAGLIEKHPGLEDVMKRFIRMQYTAMEHGDPSGKAKEERDTPEIEWKRDKNKLEIDLASLPENVVRNIVNELKGRIRHGMGENIGKSWLWGLLGPLDLQLTTSRTMTRKESSGALFAMHESVKKFPRALANLLERFSGADPTHKDYVTSSTGKKILRKYGIDQIIESIEKLATDPSLSKLGMAQSKMILYERFVWHNVRDDLGNRRLKIDGDGNMTIALQHGAARDEEGNLILWDKSAEESQVNAPKYGFSNYVSIEDFSIDQKSGKNLHVPMNKNMIKKFKQESEKYAALHKNVWEFLQKEFAESEKEQHAQLKSLVPKGWTDEDIDGLFFGPDPTKFKRIDRKTGKITQWSDLHKERQQLILQLYNNATRYSVLKPYVFNARNDDAPSEGRASFPIIYNQMRFSTMWDDMIAAKTKELNKINKELDNPRLKDPKDPKLKRYKNGLLQEKKILISTITRAEKIRDSKDDYPVDMSTGTYLALGGDVKHAKHISNQFDITRARSDKSAYSEYLQHNFTQLERNKLTIELIKNLKRAGSAPVQDLILNQYKVSLYQPDAASGFSWIKWDSDSVSKTFGKVGVNVSAAKIDRKTRQVLSYISGNLLRGWGTAAQNYTAVIQKLIDVGIERVDDAYQILGAGDKNVERLIGLSGVVDFREFFSKALTNDANTLGAENKHIMRMTEEMLKFWKAVGKLPKANTQARTKAIEKLHLELEKKLGETIRSIPSPSRLKKRSAIQRDMHRTNILRKWVNYAINKEYEAAPYLKSAPAKTLATLAEWWSSAQRRGHAPTMGKTEQELRALSFIIGVRAAMRKGDIAEMPLGDLLNYPVLVEKAIEIGVDYVETMDFGLSRQDLGQLASGNIGAFFTQCEVWSMQKFSKDLDTVRLAYQELKDTDSKYVDFKATSKMLESLVRYNKYSQDHLRTVSPRLAAFRAWIFTQGLWTALWDFGIMGPLTLIPGVKKITRHVPGIRTVGGSTSDLISLMLLVPGLAVALTYGDGDDEVEKIIDYYSKKTILGFGARWTIDAFLTMLAVIEGEDEDEYIDRANKTISPWLPPPARELQLAYPLLKKALD